MRSSLGLEISQRRFFLCVPSNKHACRILLIFQIPLTLAISLIYTNLFLESSLFIKTRNLISKAARNEAVGECIIDCCKFRLFVNEAQAISGITSPVRSSRVRCGVPERIGRPVIALRVDC